MASSEPQPWRYAIHFTLIAFTVCSVLPVWTAWYFSSWEVTGEASSFWTMALCISGATRQPDFRDLLVSFYGPEAVKLAALLLISLCLGWWIGSRSPFCAQCL